MTGKSDIWKDVRTKDQLPMDVTTGSSAARTHTENTKILSYMYRAHCGNAFRISSSNSSSTMKSHALQAGIMSLVVNYAKLYSAAFVV